MSSESLYRVPKVPPKNLRRGTPPQAKTPHLPPTPHVWPHAGATNPNTRPSSPPGNRGPANAPDPGRGGAKARKRRGQECQTPGGRSGSSFSTRPPKDEGLWRTIGQAGRTAASAGQSLGSSRWESSLFLLFLPGA